MRFFLFPILLSILLGGSGFWLNRVTDVEIIPVALNPNEPQYTLYNISVKRFDLNGEVADSLQAAQAWQLPKSKKIHLLEPKMSLQENGKPLYDVHAQNGVYDLNKKIAYLHKQVNVIKYTENGQKNVTMTTPFLHIDTIQKTATTNQGSIIENAQQKSPSRIKTIIYDTP